MCNLMLDKFWALLITLKSRSSNFRSCNNGKAGKVDKKYDLNSLVNVICIYTFMLMLASFSTALGFIIKSINMV